MQANLRAEGSQDSRRPEPPTPVFHSFGGALRSLERVPGWASTRDMASLALTSPMRGPPADGGANSGTTGGGGLGGGGARGGQYEAVAHGHRVLKWEHQAAVDLVFEADPLMHEQSVLTVAEKAAFSGAPHESPKDLRQRIEVKRSRP